MATNYQRGRAFEYRTRKRLKEMGAVYIMRAASSKGAADLIAFFHHDSIFTEVRSASASWGGKIEHKVPQPWLVQCKMSGSLPAKEYDELLRLAEETGAQAVLATKNKKGTLVFKKIIGGMQRYAPIIQVVEGEKE